MTTPTKLTAAQERYLSEIRAAGQKVYNGRARKPLEALRKAGLVEYDFDLVPHVGGVYTERFTVRPVAIEPGFSVSAYKLEIMRVGKDEDNSFVATLVDDNDYEVVCVEAHGGTPRQVVADALRNVADRYEADSGQRETEIERLRAARAKVVA